LSFSMRLRSSSINFIDDVLKMPFYIVERLVGIQLHSIVVAETTHVSPNEERNVERIEQLS